MPLYSCPICFNEEEDNTSSFIALPCDCIACADCLSQSIILKISESQYTIDSRTSCIMADCKRTLPLQEIYKRMPISHQPKMDEALLQVYFSKEKDIRKCPNPNCTYAGIINVDVFCTSPLQCNLCGSNWRDKQHYTKFEKILNYLKDRSHTKAEDLSQVWIKKRSKKCPSCKVNIEKNGGCDHMTCKHCNFQFCWICLRMFPLHFRLVHSYHQNFLHYMGILLILSIFAFILYSFGIKQTFKFFVAGLVWLISNFCILIAKFIWNSIILLVWVTFRGIACLNWLIDCGTPFLIQFISSSFDFLFQLIYNCGNILEKGIDWLINSNTPFLVELISSCLSVLIKLISLIIIFVSSFIKNSIVLTNWLIDSSIPFLTWFISSICTIIPQLFLECLSSSLTFFILLISSVIISLVWVFSNSIAFLGWLLYGITTFFTSNNFYFTQLSSSSSQVDPANLQTSEEFL